ncbi:MAG: hypothetical protein ABSG68_23575 [Thermoguttaceae bacterium]
MVYSADFPWGVQLEADAKRFDAVVAKMLEDKMLKSAADKASADKSAPERPAASKPPAVAPFDWPKPLTPVGSINGLTYLWQPVLASHPGYLQLQSNSYMRRRSEDQNAATMAFKSSEQFGPQGLPGEPDGRRYMLSMMLAVTAGRGNSLDEVFSYLGRSAAADGTHPHGTIYYVQNGDLRSRVRQGEYPAAVRSLKALGVQAEILDGAMPMDKKDVQGAMLGVADFDWKSSHSTILPGAICEHFTSFGGIMSSGGGQTPLSEMLRYGAAAASGTVNEPYAIPHKFPDAMLQVHYARGCTVAEAFYQSIFCPYQLLIVGDPLCRPWANIPTVTLTGVQDGATVSGVLKVKPEAKFSAAGSAVDHFELFADGMRVTHCWPGETASLNTAGLVDGFHELRAVAIESGLIRSQGRHLVSIVTANHKATADHKQTIEVSVSPQPTVPVRGDLTITAKTADCTGIGVFQGMRMLAKITGHEGRLEIKAASLGLGPVRLRVVGFGNHGPLSSVTSRPLDLVVEADHDKASP